MEITSYKDLIFWKKSMDLVQNMYEVTGDFPKQEQYGLTSQMRRASVSIPSNIAEGSRRSSRKDFRNFILNAYGSGAELETQIEIATRLSFITASQYQKLSSLLDEIMRMLYKMKSNLSQQQTTNYKLQTTNS